MGLVGASPLSNKMSFLYFVQNHIYFIYFMSCIENEKLSEIFANLKLNPKRVKCNCCSLH